MSTTLHFFCGKMAAGKSTLAEKLATENNAILLIEDMWLAGLYPDEITDIPGYIKYASRLHDVLADHIIAILKHKVSVVLDFPANTVNQRNWFRKLYESAGVTHTLHYVDVGDDVCKKQLEQRSKNKPAGSAFTTAEEFDYITKYFQPPSTAEGFNVTTYER